MDDQFKTTKEENDEFLESIEEEECVGCGKTTIFTFCSECLEEFG